MVRTLTVLTNETDGRTRGDAMRRPIAKGQMWGEGEAVPRPYKLPAALHVGATQFVALLRQVRWGERARRCLAPTDQLLCGSIGWATQF